MHIDGSTLLPSQLPALLLCAALASTSGNALAAEPATSSIGGAADQGTPAAPSAHAAESVPVVSLTQSARGARAKTYGASAFGAGTLALSGDVRDESELGGGFRVWGAPIDRLTLLAEATRRDNGEMAPALAIQVRAWESEGWALGALGRLKSEGFAEIEGEVELGVLGSYARAGSHVDLNVIAGRGFEEEETDGELSLRVGYDVLRALRVGLDGRVRYRLAGDALLAGGRKWDVFAGPELTLGFDHFFGALLTGPSTVGVLDGVGWEGMLTVGGTL